MIFKNKRILLISPEFYDYHIDIMHELTSQGGNVDFYPEMKQSILFRIMQKTSSLISAYLERKHVNFLLKNLKKDSYDIVFVIRGGYFNQVSMEILRKKLPSAFFVMYQWDSIKQNNYLPLVKYFDTVKTFDMNDAEHHHLEYLPLFFTEKYKQLSKLEKDHKYDLVFYGAYHSDRLEIIKEIYRQAENIGLTFKCHLYITKLALLRLFSAGVIKYQDLHFFKTYSVSAHKIINSYRLTKAVLDIELSIQSGLTIRTFEVLGSNLKLLTTNQNIKNESFFDKDRVMILNRNNIKITQDFFNAPVVADERYDKFYIANWLQSVMKIKENNK